MRPAECSRNYCWHCGEKKMRATRVKLREGVLRHEDWKGSKVPFMTLTFRSRRGYGPPEARRAETWQRWINRVANYEANASGVRTIIKEELWREPVQTISEILESRTRNSYTFAEVHSVVLNWQWSMRSELGVPLQWSGVILRGALTKDQWTAYYNGAFYKLRKVWEAEFGAKLSYVRVIELTGVGTPHLHVAYRLPTGVTTMQIWEWLKESWANIVGDDPRQIQVDAGQRKRNHSVNASLSYVLKYLSKQYGKTKDAWMFNHHRNELVGDGHEDDWDKGFRRISRSRDWPMAITGDEDMFHHADEEGEIKQYSRRDRYRAYGRMMRAIRNEAILKTEADWWEEMEKWGDAGEKELAMDAYKMVQRRKTALENIRNWRVKWIPIIRDQVMKSAYKDHGPNWRARGIMQGETFDDWWKPVFEVNGTLWRGIA